MPFPRAAGILLHPTSLPSRGGVGDFGPEAYRFVDFLASARQGVWQVLPLGPLGYGNSPYSSTSAFAGNPLLISLERLAERRWIDPSKLTGLDAGSRPVEYDQVFMQKMPLLFEAARNFLRSGAVDALWRFERFRAGNSWWLDDFVLFDALRAHFDTPQLVGLTHIVTLGNLRARFNIALDIGSSGVSGNRVCALPETHPGAART